MVSFLLSCFVEQVERGAARGSSVFVARRWTQARARAFSQQRGDALEGSEKLDPFVATVQRMRSTSRRRAPFALLVGVFQLHRRERASSSTDTLRPSRAGL